MAFSMILERLPWVTRLRLPRGAPAPALLPPLGMLVNPGQFYGISPKVCVGALRQPACFAAYPLCSGLFLRSYKIC